MVSVIGLEKMKVCISTGFLRVGVVCFTGETFYPPVVESCWYTVNRKQSDFLSQIYCF